MVLQRVGTIMVISKQDLPHIGHPNPFKMGSIPKPYYHSIASKSKPNQPVIWEPMPILIQSKNQNKEIKLL